MDSMRHLSKSLPQTSRRRIDHADLLSSFKAAALSVTNLYKTAASDSAQAREAGYQDALEDLLAFLDRDNIGLGDGEGWQVRRWISERLDTAPQGRQAVSEDEEDVAKGDEVETRSSSPEVQRKSSLHPSSSELVDEATLRPSSEPPLQQPSASTATSAIVPSLDDFSFRAAAQLPTNHDREGQHNMDLDNIPNPNPSTIRLIPKSSTKARNSIHPRRDINRGSTAATINLNLGPAVGSKRKIPYPDFFDIGGLNFDGQDKRDGGGRGGKRNRHA